jgi:hypothetical protein
MRKIERKRNEKVLLWKDQKRLRFKKKNGRKTEIKEYSATAAAFFIYSSPVDFLGLFIRHDLADCIPLIFLDTYTVIVFCNTIRGGFFPFSKESIYTGLSFFYGFTFSCCCCSQH